MPSILRAAFAALSLLLTIGCGGPSEGTVTGTVMLDGEPLKDGIIRFEPTDGKSNPVDAPVSNGNYQVKLVPGAAKVVIRANKVVGKTKMYDTPDSPTVDKVVELIDAQFNDASTLTLTVVAGQQTKDWQISKRK